MEFYALCKAWNRKVDFSTQSFTTSAFYMRFFFFICDVFFFPIMGRFRIKKITDFLGKDQ